jgi:pimeloyl-ACP methyl ester carboxylesterase
MKRKKLLLQMAGCMLVVLLLVTCGAPPPTPKPTSQPDLYDVGGYKMRMICGGSGTPPVILEGNWEEGVYTWQPIQSEVARFTQACTYDRAGLGLSDEGPAPRSCQAMVDELHTLLGQVGVEGPYVLVGSGNGGLTARIYADQYPDEVAGMVLLDSEHPNQRERLEGHLPSWWAPWPNFQDLDWEACTAQVEATGSLGDLPLLVLTGQGQPFSEQGNRLWFEMQEELAGLSTNSTHTIIEGSGHHINEDQPEAVVDAIRSIVEAIRGE